MPEEQDGHPGRWCHRRILRNQAGTVPANMVINAKGAFSWWQCSFRLPVYTGISLSLLAVTTDPVVEEWYACGQGILDERRMLLEIIHDHTGCSLRDHTTDNQAPDPS